MSGRRLIATPQLQTGDRNNFCATQEEADRDRELSLGWQARALPTE